MKAQANLRPAETYCYLAALVVGAGLAGGALAACSAVDPNPPNPHVLPDPDPFLSGIFDGDPQDGGDPADAAEDAEAGQ